MVEGIPAGQVNHDVIDRENRRTELDIWMNSESNCSKGYGSEALQVLCEHVTKTRGISELLIRPSARNLRAIRAYEKAGFQRVEMTPEEQEKEYGPGECSDSVIMIKNLKPLF